MGDHAVWQQVWASVLLFLPRLATGLLVLLGFWLAGSAARRFAERLANAKRIDPDLTLLLGRIAKVSLLFFGIVTALGTMGVDVSALVTGLGLTGFAVGFALRDIISNALSGMLVILYKPFKNGDHIAVTALEGTVTDVNLRYTVLHHDGKRIFVPNSALMTNPIIVTTREGAEPVSNLPG